MKSIAKICFAALVISAAFSCTKEALVEKNQQIKEGMMPYEATISMDATKASLDGKTVVWTVGDKVAIYDNVNAEANEFQVVSASGNTATITGQISQEATTLWGVFPFSAAAGVDKEQDILSVNVPSTQEIATGKTIAADALVSVSKAAVGATLNFKNAVSLVKFTLPIDGVKRVVFSGSTGATGAMGVKIADPLVITYSGTSSLTVSKADGFAKNTAYYATVFAQDQTGVKFVLTTADYKSVVSSDKAASFAVNAGLNFTLEEAKINAGKFPLNIKTKADLDAFGANASDYEAGEWVKLDADIDYNSGEWITTSDFAGNFDGQNHSVYNIIIKVNESDKAGFIGRLVSSSEMKDMKLGYKGTGYDGTSKIDISAITTTTPVIGSFAAATIADDVKLTNLVNYMPTDVTISSALASTSFKIGGIIGQLGKSSKGATVKSCNNYGAITMNHTAAPGTHAYLAGIAGLVDCIDGTIESCYNYANIEGAATTAINGHAFIGGIVGRTSSNADNLVITGCANEGTLKVSVDLVKGGPYIGGILGGDNVATNKTSIINCTNGVKDKADKGNISTSSAQTKGVTLGGIMGYLKGITLIDNCHNYGSVVKEGDGGGSNSYLGGILARSETSNSAKISNCENRGDITEKEQTVSATNCIGGVAGIAKLDVENCVNYANVSSAGAVGAICVGGVIGTHEANALKNCQNYGKVTLSTSPSVNAACGGLIGRQNNNNITTGEGCLVNCQVSSNNAGIGGMIVGNYPKDKFPTVSYGTESEPIKVAGKFNDTDIISDNYTTYLSGKDNANAKFYASFLAE